MSSIHAGGADEISTPVSEEGPCDPHSHLWASLSDGMRGRGSAAAGLPFGSRLHQRSSGQQLSDVERGQEGDAEDPPGDEVLEEVRPVARLAPFVRRPPAL